MNNTLVYVHGTNGSGKSTLARALIQHAGGVRTFMQWNPFSKNGYTTTHKGIIMLGKYTTACGGVDGIQPYAQVLEMLEVFGQLPGSRVFAEGLVTPGLDTCQRMADMFENHLFILLDTHVEQCIVNVLARRTERSKTTGKASTPYNPENLYKKDRSARLWADRLEAAGINLQRLKYDDALKRTTAMLTIKRGSQTL